MSTQTNAFGDPVGETAQQQSVLPQQLREPERQRIRNVLQGMTFNTADEAEAFVTSMLSDKTYEEAMDEINEKLRIAQEAFPGETAVEQISGAVIPAAIAGFLTKGKVQPSAFTSQAGKEVAQRYFPNLMRVMGIGAAETAASEMGRQRGSISERASQVGPREVIQGAGLSGGLQVGGGLAIKTVQGLVNGLRSVGSSISGNVVNREIQRIARENNLSPDVVAESLASGRIFADNPAVAEELRRLKAPGGITEEVFFPPRQMPEGPPRPGAQRGSLGGSFVERPAVRREEATRFIEQGLGAGYGQNTVRIARANEQQLRNIVNDAYQSVDIEPVSADVYQAMRSALQRSKGLENKLNNLYRSETGQAPFFKWNRELDRYEFERAPTNMEAEYLRRALDAESTSLLEAGRGMDTAIGSNLMDASQDLRGAIDRNYSGITEAREIAAGAFATNRAFKNGKRASANFEVAQDQWTQILESASQDQIDSFRLGYLANLKTRLRGGNKASYVKKLLDPNDQVGMLFMTVFPENKLDEAINKLGIASDAANAYTKVFGNSITADILLGAKRQGKLDEAIGFGTSAAMATTNIFSAVQFADKVITAMTPNLSTRQRKRIAEKLISDDPRAIIDAMTDNTALGNITRKLAGLAGLPLESAAIATGSRLSLGASDQPQEDMNNG
jgi:hypothetical protein